ncbi:XRE family transcriptional regulator [Streptomyces sp. MZ04]|uniref:helix-turn-helix domain-containing protein n=1 Tax=Streptomyces sp. MZ04 TaxID=2559236 RepID=UPI00107E791F|nr:XRE family transcriptional regulator [Streptomyces sp. MZ04]TGB05555.1 XRE family transcriptional regulator [Streptomyces sp. MZ04]
MPRWKALPDELDPEVREFANQLRRLVDRSGLSIAAVSDRTGYSKTSWERYLNGRLLAPKGAIVALAEVTGTNPVHLITMWELAERAWSRSEMRHDMTMQAIRISQARAALGELGPNPPKGKGGTDTARGGSAGTDVDAGGRGGRSVTGVAGPAGVSPTVPPQASPSAGAGAGAYAASSYGVGDGGRGPAVAPPGAQEPRRGGDSPDGQRRRRKLTMFLAGTVGALVVIAAAVFLTDFGKDDKGDEGAKPPASPTTSDTDLPAGVECSGKSCTGKDPETMGCGGELAKTTTRATVGKALIEVRYSKTCGAAWARITQAAVGDKVTISADAGAKQAGTVNADFDAYTPMTAVKDGTSAEACATLKTGVTGCTK